MTDQVSLEGEPRPSRRALLVVGAGLVASALAPSEARAQTGPPTTVDQELAMPKLTFSAPRQRASGSEMN